MTIAPVPVHRRPTPWIVVLFLTVVTIAVVAIVLVVRHDGTQSSSVSGTTQGSGVAAVQPRHVASFTGVELAGTNLVTVKVGGQRSVVVRADDNLLRQVTTQVSASTLVIGDKGSFSAKSPMSVEVTVPSLDRLVLSGTGNVAVAGIQTQQLKVVLSGDGTVQAAGTATHLAVVSPRLRRDPARRPGRARRWRGAPGVGSARRYRGRQPRRCGARQRRDRVLRQPEARHPERERQRVDRTWLIFVRELDRAELVLGQPHRDRPCRGRRASAPRRPAAGRDPPQVRLPSARSGRRWCKPWCKPRLSRLTKPFCSEPALVAEERQHPADDYDGGRDDDPERWSTPSRDPRAGKCTFMPKILAISVSGKRKTMSRRSGRGGRRCGGAR